MTDSEIHALGNIPAILDGTFFRIERYAKGKISARCMSCQKSYSGSLTVTSNYLKHLKDKHHTMMPRYDAHKHATQRPNRRVPAGQSDDVIDNIDVTTESELTLIASTASTESTSMFRKGWQKKNGHVGDQPDCQQRIAVSSRRISRV